jgi:thymidylate synthase (FAD)
MIKVLNCGFVSLVDSMPTRDYVGPLRFGSGDQRVVDAARVSIAGAGVRPMSEDAKLLRYLMANKHTTPFEQVRFTFHAKMPIFVARQWIRHRTGSFNEMSGRYGILPDEFYIPALDRMASQSKSNKQGSGDVLPEPLAEQCAALIAESAHASYKAYETLLGNGLAREIARAVLPVTMYTQWYWTTDLHNLMHFLRLRLHSHAQYEIRVYAEAIRELVRPIVPCTMEAFDESLRSQL